MTAVRAEWVGKKVAVTGHRPNKLSFCYDHDGKAFGKLVGVATGALEQLRPVEVITGMALGWDQAVAEACIQLRIPFAAYLPFADQDFKWPKKSREYWEGLLAFAARTVIVSAGRYSASKMQIRNERMVDDGDLLLALWNRTPGGTGNCVEYARSKNRLILNVWRRWELAAKEVASG
jgi:uncharacterized phage-like protein YoqJ